MAYHQTLKLLEKGDLVALQPFPAPAGSSSVETLSVDLATGKASLSSQPALTATATTVFGVVGVYKLESGAALCVITAAQQVATVHGQPVYKVRGTKFFHGSAKFTKGEKRLLLLLRDAVDPDGAGRNLHFSWGADLTLTSQRRQLELDAPVPAPLSKRADPRFFWNRLLAEPLVDASAERFVLTLILGSVHQITGLTASAHGKSLTLDITLIARKATKRAGTRHWRRGADLDGGVANFTETEQLLSLGDGTTLASFVQVRGSIPVVWTQIPNIKYKPPLRILDGSKSSLALEKHFDELVDKYKAAVAIDLVNQHGSEGKLEVMYQREAQRYADTHNHATKYVPFDFHKQCGATNYGRLSLLWDQLSTDFNDHGFFVKEQGAVVQQQAGTFRTNCIDCLDRTNVVQGVLGRKALEAVLVHLGVLTKDDTVAKSLPEVERGFKVIWADHGDDVSRQYAGTGALKSGFTRTGKRTLGGLIDDGIKSLARYYLNNFEDGGKQDAIDLITGAYSPPQGKTRRLEFPQQPSLLAPLLLAGGLLLLAAFQASQLLNGQPAILGEQFSENNSWGMLVAVPGVLASALLFLTFKNKKQFVNRPQLCPELADTVGGSLPIGSGKGSKLA